MHVCQATYDPDEASNIHHIRRKKFKLNLKLSWSDISDISGGKSLQKFEEIEYNIPAILIHLISFTELFLYFIFDFVGPLQS